MKPLRPILLPAVLLGLGAAVWFLGRVDQRRVGIPRGPRVMLRLEEDASLEPAIAKGLEILLRDHLDLHATCTVLPWAQDGDPVLQRMDALPSLQVRVWPHREGGALGLRLAWAPKREGPWQESRCDAGPPRAALSWLSAALPQLRLGAPDDGLAPEGPAFWELAEAVGLSRTKGDDARALALARHSVLIAPRCATAKATLALTLMRTGVRDPVLQAQVLELLEGALKDAPHHPRISYITASVLVEMGRHREALAQLHGAVRAHPDLPDPLQGVVYAARTSGLLELAGRAHRAEESLLLLPPPRLPLLVLLYRWELEAFERNCRAGMAQRPTVGHFYLGYLALAAGRTEEARNEMTLACSPVTPGWEDIGELARIWGLHLDGRGDEAMKALLALDQRRAADRIPDGEFTLMLAEAHDLLGDPEGALDQAHRALTLGFACTSWYQRSPFLAGARRLPRWKPLEADLLARQKLLEESFPPESFGL